MRHEVEGAIELAHDDDKFTHQDGVCEPGATRHYLRSSDTDLANGERQAPVGQGTIPVKFVVAGSSSRLFGTFPTAQTYNHPAKDLQYQDLAPIWITAPERGHVDKAGTSVVVTGESCAFEATTQWQLKKSGSAFRSGTTTASSACPTRGTWTVDLGVPSAGDYAFRMYEVSMQDGKGIVAETSKPLTVR